MAKSNQGLMSWERFWAYFVSDLCTDEMREWTLQNTSIVDCLTGTTSDVQQEIIRDAPDYIKNDPQVQRVLISKSSVVSSSDKVFDRKVFESLSSHEDRKKYFYSMLEK